MAYGRTDQPLSDNVNSFHYQSAATRIVFGAGRISDLADEMKLLNCSRALLLSTPGQLKDAQALASAIGHLSSGIFSNATMHTPLEVTEAALHTARECGADCTVALGGGSTIGLGKAISARTGLKQIAIPTTYAGSEVTPILGETVNGNKTTRRAIAIQPDVVIYDADLTLSLPTSLSATSGLNAMAHAIEALYARDANPITSLMAEEAIKALAQSLPVVVTSPYDKEARSTALYGAWLAGTCLGSVGMALHHKICHVLGGTFDLPHAETHSVMIPHVTAFNAPAATQSMVRVARALGADDATTALFELARSIGVPRSLEELGMPESGIEVAVDKVTRDPYWNPRPIERDSIRKLLADAFHGHPPSNHD